MVALAIMYGVSVQPSSGRFEGKGVAVYRSTVYVTAHVVDGIMTHLPSAYRSTVLVATQAVESTMARLPALTFLLYTTVGEWYSGLRQLLAREVPPMLSKAGVM